MVDRKQSVWTEVGAVELDGGITETTSHMRVMGGFMYRISTSWKGDEDRPGGRAEALAFVPVDPEVTKNLRPQVRRAPTRSR